MKQILRAGQVAHVLRVGEGIGQLSWSGTIAPELPKICLFCHEVVYPHHNRLRCCNWYRALHVYSLRMTRFSEANAALKTQTICSLGVGDWRCIWVTVRQQALDV